MVDDGNLGRHVGVEAEIDKSKLRLVREAEGGRDFYALVNVLD